LILGNETIIHEQVCEVITAPAMASAAFRKVWDAATAALDDGLAGELTWTPKKRTRSLEQNALMWVLLGDIAKQTDWHGIKLSDEEFKDLLTAGLVQSKVVPNIQGTGFVILGRRTSKMSIKEMNDLIILIETFGIERGVKFSADPKKYYKC
jgi:urease gamma subunit